MDSPSALRIVKVLRATLQCVEESGVASPGSMELDHLKQHVVRAVSELEAQKSPGIAPKSQTPESTATGQNEEPVPKTAVTEAPIVVLRMR